MSGSMRRAFCGHRRSAIFGKTSAAWAFMREFVQAPTHVGSICPSSKALTSVLIDAVPAEKEGLILDLGAGSGSVTEELLRAGIPPERILALELSPGFRGVFSSRCPGVPLIIGDARHLNDILDIHAPGQPLCSVISSLPFRVMPSSVVREILHEVRRAVSQRGGLLVQYTYAWWMRYPLRKYGFSPQSSNIVLGNLPPAKVESYAA